MRATTLLEICGCETGLVDGRRICRAACSVHGGQLNDWACPCSRPDCDSDLPQRALPAWFLLYRLQRQDLATAARTGGPAGADARGHLPLTPQGGQAAAEQP